MYAVIWKCLTAKDKHRLAKSDLKSSITSIAFSSPCGGVGGTDDWEQGRAKSVPVHLRVGYMLPVSARR